MSHDLFAEFSDFGDRVLAGIDQGERSAQKFKYLIGVINQTLMTTHRIVLARLATIREATDVNEAATLLESIRVEQLSEAFRIEGLCDTLGGLGEGLRRRASDARNEGAFSAAELSDVEEFADMLYDREYEVATIYAQTLADLTDMSEGLDPDSLPMLKERTKELEHILTTQVSDFRAKARQFMTLTTE